MRIITIDSNKKVIGTKTVNDSYIQNPGLQTGEIISETGETGQIMQTDGTFITPTPVPVEPVPTVEEQVAQLKSDNLILMDALATTFEEILILEDKITALGGTPA